MQQSYVIGQRSSIPHRVHWSARYLPRATWYVFFLCLIGGTIVLTAVVHSHNNQVLLISTESSAARMPVTPVSSTRGPSTNASKALLRINQNSLAEYASRSEHDTWWPSACSPASLTEVMDAYGRQLRITDVLQAQKRIGAISAELGLLSPAGIDDTAQQFGFKTSTLSNPTVSQVIETAKSGQPVIVNFPSHKWTASAPEWTTGHFLVVIGGTDHTIQLADSSTVNGGAGLQTVSISYFTTYWHGYAKVLTPESTPYSVRGKPTLSVDFINRVLEAYSSPAAAHGQAFYDLGVQYGIDPAYALAFFLHESTMGTQGEARTTMSLGNLRCIPDHPCVDKDRGGYAQMANWEDGFKTWYQLMRNYYIDKLGLVTVDRIIPVYAPNSDNNNEQGYIKALKHYVDTWHAGSLKP